MLNVVSQRRMSETICEVSENNTWYTPHCLCLLIVSAPVGSVPAHSVGAIHGMSGTGSYLPCPAWCLMSHSEPEPEGWGRDGPPCPAEWPGSVWPPVTAQPRSEPEPPESSVWSGAGANIYRWCETVFRVLQFLYFDIWRDALSNCANKMKTFLNRVCAGFQKRITVVKTIM